MKGIEIRDFMGDYALDIPMGEGCVHTIYFNSRRNAEMVKRIMEVDDSVPNAATVCDVVEVVRCKDCVYFQPNFVETNNGERRPYTEEEKNSPLGMVTCDVGVNCGSRCERFDYWEDNRFPVWFQENDFCSYGKKKEQT